MTNSIRNILTLTRSGKLSCQKNVEDKIQIANAKNKELQAHIHIAKETALKQAKENDALQQKERYLGKLHGLTFSAKSNLAVTAMPTTESSANSGVLIAKKNAPMVQRLIDEGAICVGKGHMPEYGKSTGATISEFGTTKNPINPKYSPGGSTGGGAAAVASGMADFCIGGESGGSIRVPAAWCGLTGILPTRNTLYSLPNPFSVSSITNPFASPGIIARKADDLSIVLTTLQDPHPDNPEAVPFSAIPLSNLGSDLSSNRGKKQFAYFSSLSGVQCDSEITKSIKNCVSKLEKLGWKAKEITPPSFDAATLPFILIAGQASLIQEDAIASIQGKPRDPKKETPILHALREKIKTVLPELTVEQLLTTLYQVDILKAQATKFLQEYSFIISPLAACKVPKLEDTNYQVDGKEIQSHEVFHFSRVVNLLGLPAVGFSHEMDSNGLPLSMQIVGPRFSDLSLLQIVDHIQ